MKHRYELPLYSFYDHTGMTTHLEEMAQRGWLLDKMGGMFWRYRKVEPQRLRFALVYFPEVTGFEPTKPEGHSRMEDLCAGTGWQLAATAGKFQIYYNEDPDPVELETDPMTQVQVIHRTMKKNFLPSYAILAVMSVLQLVMQITNLTRDFGLQYSGAVYYFSGVSWLMIPVWSALLLLYVLELSRYLLWYRRAKKRAEEELMTPSPASRWVQTLAILLLLGILLSWLGSGAMTQFVYLTLLALLAVLVISVLAAKLMKRMKVSAWLNQIITMSLAVIVAVLLIMGMANSIISSHREPPVEGQLPLRLEDLGYATTENRVHMEVQGTPLITRTYCLHRPDRPQTTPELEYIIADVHAKFLWNTCVEDFLKNGAQSVDAAPWQADSAWRVNNRFSSEEFVYVLTWGDRLVWLDLEIEPTDAQKTTIAQKLMR